MGNRNHVLGQSSKRNTHTGQPELQSVIKEALRISNVRKVHCPDFSIISVLRSAEEQFKLYQKGRVLVGDSWQIQDANKIVTYCDGYDKTSTHQTGLAVDFLAWVDGKSNDELHNLVLIATCFFEACSNLGYDCDWGGSFKSISDVGHFEVIL